MICGDRRAVAVSGRNRWYGSAPNSRPSRVSAYALALDPVLSPTVPPMPQVALDYPAGYAELMHNGHSQRHIDEARSSCDDRSWSCS